MDVIGNGKAGDEFWVGVMGWCQRGPGVWRVVAPKAGGVKQDTPRLFWGAEGCCILATSYFRGAYRPTIIGATVFHFRVRNGNGWDHRAMITRWGAARFAGPGTDDPGGCWDLGFPDSCAQGENKFVIEAWLRPGWKWNDVRQTDD